MKLISTPMNNSNYPGSGRLCVRHLVDVVGFAMGASAASDTRTAAQRERALYLVSDLFELVRLARDGHGHGRDRFRKHLRRPVIAQQQTYRYLQTRMQARFLIREEPAER